MQEAKPRPMTLGASENRLQAPTKLVMEAAGTQITAHVQTRKTNITAADAARVQVASASLMASAMNSMLQEGPVALIRQVPEARVNATRIPVAHCLVFTPHDSIRHA